MNDYKAVIFDLDGTLADTLDDLQVAMNKMLVSYGWPERSRDELLSFINQGARRFVAQSMPEGSYDDESDDSVTEALRIYSEKYAEAYCVHTAPYGNIKAELEKLKADGYKLAVLSNKQDAFVKVIVKNLFPGIFEIAAGQSDLPTKPDPTAALFIADKLGVSPDKCIFVGDSDVDMKTGVNAGMYSLGVSWGYRSPDVLTAAGAKSLVREPGDLFTVISSL